MMLWNPFRRRRMLREAAERFRREHSVWLSRAMLSGRAYPRIPTRPVSRGGYEPMMRRPHGAGRAAAWWSGALERVDDV